uniref:Uncharacterized protein n=1 Tax=Oryza glaberrima TaxID=4538 RepID=I1QFZ4_ORYGL
MSPSACSTPPNPPRWPTVSLAEIEIASVLCVVCCRWHGACGRTDRPLCWPVIGHPRARGSMPSAFTNSQMLHPLSLGRLNVDQLVSSPFLIYNRSEPLHFKSIHDKCFG